MIFYYIENQGAFLILVLPDLLKQPCQFLLLLPLVAHVHDLQDDCLVLIQIIQEMHRKQDQYGLFVSAQGWSFNRKANPPNSVFSFLFIHQATLLKYKIAVGFT